ncbi:hypothetical protein SLH46_01895 [Draconibacterium sp. IB214405]|uniref:hypothetical protein n=1 Tax=Draconibacterium sp. IB214405 TaxID=3097352 RepID=UPI002A168153|nr:hypothetical protein [Draconibacterium sp. IB214405]MDX8337915.1 hypothetical protein [Draconibacterium sp. IB214405]
MKSLIISLIFLSLLNYSFAQQQTDTSLFEPVADTLTNIRFFDKEEPLKVTLKYDITSFIKHKSKGEYLPAELAIYTSDNDSVIKNIRLKARGNFRRSHCFFPPIYLNFKTDPIDKTELEGIKKIKIVTHCNMSQAYKSYIIREYLAYEIFNILTPNSFRVRLLNVNYVDTGKKKRNYKQIGFLIEPIDLITRRLNAVEVNENIIVGKNVLPVEGTLVALYQYFIANTDWRYKGGHNMKYVKSMETLTNNVIPLPYDFDHAGFVNTSYAIPQDWSGASTITDRDYLGYCQTNDETYHRAINLFNEKKPEVIAAIESCELLDKRDKKEVLTFVNEFYKMAEYPEYFIRTLKNECRDLDF